MTKKPPAPPLFTPTEFEDARAKFIVEHEYDPCDDSDSFERGWRRDGYSWRRGWYSWPTKWTRCWLPHAGFGTDEWCNPTFYFALPFLGGVTIRYRRGPLRGWADGACSQCEEEMGLPSCPLCGHVHNAPCLPVTVLCRGCQVEFRSDRPGLTWFGYKPYCSRDCVLERTRDGRP